MKKSKILFIALFTILLLLPFTVKANEGSTSTVISLPCPDIGDTPTYIHSTEYTSRFDEMWVNKTDYKEMGPNDKFEAGKTYNFGKDYALVK